MLTPISPHYQQAVEMFERGQLPQAEMLCRQALAEAPRNGLALNLIGQIAGALGMHEHAVSYYRAAIAADPSIRRAEFNLRDSEKAIAARPPRHVEGERFLLIKAWGSGFWADIDHVLGQLLVAEITGRKPIVHWGASSLYSDDPNQDAFSTFFEPVSVHSLNEIAGHGFEFYPDKWTNSNLNEDVNKWAGVGSRLHALLTLNRHEKVVVSDFHTGLVNLLAWIPGDHPLRRKSPGEVYRWLIAKYLEPRNDIRTRIETFYAQKMAGRIWVAAHIRGTDKLLDDPNLSALHEKFPDLIRRGLARHPDAGLFLITDCALTREHYAELFGDRLLTTDCVRSATGVGVHQMEDLPSRRQIGVETIIDTYLAARADYFLGTGSSHVSCFVMHLGNWTPSTCLMLDPVVQYRPNIALYDAPMLAG